MKLMKQSLRTGNQPIRLKAAGCMLALGLLPITTTATAQTPLQRQQVEALVPQIESHIKASMEAWQVPGLAIGIVAEDELVYAKGFGVREINSSDPVDTDTLFQIGSATKAFLGVTEAILVDRGKLSWTDKVVDHHPDFQLADPWVTREFEIADLLAQRSGLPPYALTNMTLYDYSRADIVKALRHVEPVSSFRSEFAYQNAFHIVAGDIVASRGGTDSWEAFLQSELLDPLGMSSTSYEAQAMDQAENRSRGHRREAQDTVVDPWAPFPYNAGGAGNLNSSVNDMSRWLRMQINQGEIDGKRIVSAEALGATHEPRIAISGFMQELMKQGEYDQLSYATGWVVHSTPQGRIIEHGGGTTGFTSQVAFDPDRRFGVVVLTNLSGDIGAGLALPLGKYVMDLLQDRPVVDHADQMLDMLRKNQGTQSDTLQPPADARPARPLQDYAGRYSSPTLGQVEIKAAEGGLSFELGPRNIHVTLEPWSGDVFVSSVPLATHGPGPYLERRKLTFLSDRNDRITGFDWVDGVDGAGQPPFTRDDDTAKQH